MPLVTVARFDHATQAHLAATLLADAGIPTRVVGEHAGGLVPLFSTRAGAVRLEVPEAHADEAREVLAAADGEA
jgi:hypothetical protein